MSKQIRTLIIAGVSIVVLGALLLTLFLLPGREGGEVSSSATVSSDPGITLTDKTTGSDKKPVSQPIKKAVFKLAAVEEVKDDEGNVTTPAKEAEEYTVILNEEEELVVEAYADLPINTYLFTGLSSDLANIVATKKVENTGVELADYGFDKPLVSVTVTYHDDTEYSFEIGKRTPLKDGYYFREAGTDTVYIVEDSFGTVMLRSSINYVGTSLYVSPTVEEDDEDGQAILRDMKLSGTVRPQTFSFRAVTSEDNSEIQMSNYVLTSPYLRNTDSVYMESLTGSLTSLSAQKAVIVRPTEEQLEEYGFNNPYSVADLNVAVKSVEKSEEGSADSEAEEKTRYYNVQHHVVTLGSKDEDGNYYCMIDELPVIYLVSASSVPWAETQYNDVADKMLFMRNITTIASVSIQINGKETVFNLAHHPDEEDSNDTLTVTVDGKTYRTKEFRTFYSMLMQIARTGDAKAEPEGEPYLVVTLKSLDEEVEDMVAKFYKATSSTYTCVQHTGETYRVNATTVENIEKQMNKYLAGEALDTTW